jgi:hypothetical protein
MSRPKGLNTPEPRSPRRKEGELRTAAPGGGCPTCRCGAGLCRAQSRHVPPASRRPLAGSVRQAHGRGAGTSQRSPPDVTPRRAAPAPRGLAVAPVRKQTNGEIPRPPCAGLGMTRGVGRASLGMRRGVGCAGLGMTRRVGCGGLGMTRGVGRAGLWPAPFGRRTAAVPPRRSARPGCHPEARAASLECHPEARGPRAVGVATRRFPCPPSCPCRSFVAFVVMLFAPAPAVAPAPASVYLRVLRGFTCCRQCGRRTWASASGW